MKMRKISTLFERVFENHQKVDIRANVSVMLYGHIHSDGNYNLANREAGIKRYDVGVDANG